MTREQYNADIRPYAENLYKWNEAEQEQGKFRLQYGRGIHESKMNMEKAGVLDQYFDLLHKVQEISKIDSQLIMHLYQLGYDNSQLPHKSEVGNFVDVSKWFYNDR